MSTTTAVQKHEPAARPARVTPEMERMDALAREAQAMSNATMVPKEYQGNPGNCLLAIDVARRTGVPVLTVTQNLYIIQGRPSWSSKFLIGAVNNCGRFSPIRFEMEGEESQPGWRCRAVATAKVDNERLEGPWITWEMAQAEGWVNKSGSKWRTMPDLMIRYRAAAFWARLYAPDISLGLMTAEEVRDIPPPAAVRAQSIADALDGVEIGSRVAGADEPTDAEAGLVQKLMEDATAAGVLDYEDREALEFALHRGDGPEVRQGIRDLQRAIARASTTATTNGELPLEGEQENGS